MKKTQQQNFEFYVALMPAIHKIEEETGEYFGAWFQALKGEQVEEFTDIKWTAVQMLLNWASETGDDFEACTKEFMKEFRAELKNLKAQGFPHPGTGTYAATLENPLRQERTL